MPHLNPYIAGNPIDDRSVFFGRQDIFREVMQVLRHPQSNAIVLYGQRRIGKTSVLLQLKHQLVEEGNFTPVYFDLQDKAAKPLGRVLLELAQRIATETKQTLPNQENFDQSGEYFQKTFLPEITEKIGVGSLVLLFDEFDVLDSPVRGAAGQDFFPYLRTWMTDLEGEQFVFVIGRRPEDLSVDTLSTFKAVRASRVSVLEQKEAEAIVRQSERSKSLAWTKGAIDKIWSWTHGHPYFTQLLCSVVWDHAYEESPSETPRVGVEEVDVAIKDALKRGANAFQWIWDGLPPAERVVSAAMAEASNEIITQDELAEILRRSGVRLIVRELELAPDTLVEWEVLKPTENGYRFMVPLLRRWVADNRPLRRVKDELDRLDPLAENLFQAGQGFYVQEQLEEAENQLRQALRINPNHLKSRLLLGRILLEEKRLSEAVDVLDEAYQYDSTAVRADLVKALLALADATESDDEQLTIYEKVQNIDKMQVTAREKHAAIWIKRGESKLSQNSFDEALIAFQKAGDQDSVQKVLEKKRESVISPRFLEAEKKEAKGNWVKAIEIYESLLQEYPDDNRIIEKLKNARIQLALLFEAVKKWEEVVKLYEAILRTHPSDEIIIERLIKARVYIAEKHEVDKNWVAAVTVYRQLLETSPNDKAIRKKYEAARYFFKETGFQTAAMYENKGNWVKALETYETLEQEYQHDDRISDRLKNARIQLAEQHENSKNWDKAVNIYESLLLKNTGDKRLKDRLENAKTQARLMRTYNQAITALNGGESGKAQRLLADIIFEQPDFEDAPLYLLHSIKKSNHLVVEKAPKSKINQSLLYWLFATIILGIIIFEELEVVEIGFSIVFIAPLITLILSYLRPIEWWQILLYQSVIVLSAVPSGVFADVVYPILIIIYTVICSVSAYFSKRRQITILQIPMNPDTQIPKSSLKKGKKAQLDGNKTDQHLLQATAKEGRSRVSFRRYLSKATKLIFIISSLLAVIGLIGTIAFGDFFNEIGFVIGLWFMSFIAGHMISFAIYIIIKFFEFLQSKKNSRRAAREMQKE